MTVSTKVLRVFVFSFLGAFALAFSNALIEYSQTGDWSVLKGTVVALLVASVSAGIRAVVAYLPVLPDDDVGMRRG